MGSPQLPPLSLPRSRSPPLSSLSLSFSSAARAVLVGVISRAPATTPRSETLVCPLACEGAPSLPPSLGVRCARVSFNSSSVAEGLDLSDLSLYSVSVCRFPRSRSFPPPCVCLCEREDDAPDILPSPFVAPFVWMRNMCQFRERVVMPPRRR